MNSLFHLEMSLNGLSYVYFKQIIDFLQILNIINYTEFYETDEMKSIFSSDILSISLLKLISFDCLFACNN